MKTKISTILCFLFFCGLFAQEIPRKISYQGKLIENGIVVNGTKNITFTIGSWSETKTVQVTEGLYSVTLGETIPIPLSIFDNISVALQISVGGTNLSPQTGILSVPYAYKSEIAVSAENVFSGNYNDLINQPINVSHFINDAGYVTSVNDADADPTNELQNLSEVLSRGNNAGNIKITGLANPTSNQDAATKYYVDNNDNVNDADADPSNEIQILSRSGTNVSLSKGGGSVSIADDDNSPTNETINTFSFNSSSRTLLINDGSGNKTANLSSLAGLSLPYFGTCSGPGIAFITASTGTSGGAGSFYIDNASNSTDALSVSTNGTGRAGYFRINNGSNNKAALYTYTTGRGLALYARSIGLGWGGAFEIANTNNSSPAIYVTTNGTGPAGQFEIYNSSNSDDVISAYTNGTGRAGYFRINNGSNNSRALYATTNGTGYAAYFSGRTRVYGDFSVSGHLSKGSGSFKIDHPIAPANKYLFHSFVESPDMMNIYNGNVILDENGEAIVELPEYFEALNMEFRYQLTCIGGFAQVYISEEILNNSFEISGGFSGLKVSWQVTGIRNDPYAKENRVQVEVEKAEEEKGKYLHYKEYGQPIENSIENE